MTNLLNETMSTLKSIDQRIEDIKFIGSLDSGHSCTWVEFTQLADIEYDNGFGAQEIASDLVIVFEDGTQLYRDEYDGSECWAYKAIAVIPRDQQPIKSLTGGMWNTLEAMHNE